MKKTIVHLMSGLANIVRVFFKVNAQPNRYVHWFLSVVLFALAIGAYVYVSEQRYAENPKDKLMPTVYKKAALDSTGEEQPTNTLFDGFKRTAFEQDRKGEYRLWVDTLASGKRVVISLAIISTFGVLLGLHMGTFPYLDSILFKVTTFFDKTPAVAILPILFITFGLGEMAKIALIVIGVMPTIILDTRLRAKEVPRERVVKAMTLKASNFEILYRVVLPEVIPKVLDTIRLNFKAVLLFLIVGEALAAKAGLGYRIFVVRRYIAMDIIIPYVIWMSLLAFIADLAVQGWIKWRYPWVDKE